MAIKFFLAELAEKSTTGGGGANLPPNQNRVKVSHNTESRN